MSLTAAKKISKVGDPEELELDVAGHLVDIESSVPQLQAQLAQLTINAVKRVELPDGSDCVLIFVPQPQLKRYHTVQQRLVDELQKRMHVENVLVIAQRKILPKESRKNHLKRQKRPRSRTLTAVHEAILDDLVFPAQITGKSTRYRVEGPKVLNVKLNTKSKEATEGKVDVFSFVYKKLTGKDTSFTYQG